MLEVVLSSGLAVVAVLEGLAVTVATPRGQVGLVVFGVPMKLSLRIVVVLLVELLHKRGKSAHPESLGVEMVAAAV